MELLLNYGVYAIVGLIVLMAVFQRKALVNFFKAQSIKLADVINTNETKLLTKKADIRDKITGLQESIANTENMITTCKTRIKTTERDLNTILSRLGSMTDEVEINISKKRAISFKQSITSYQNKIVTYQNNVINAKRMIMLLEDRIQDLDTALNDLKTNATINTAEIKQILSGDDATLREVLRDIDHNQTYNEIASQDIETHLSGSTGNVDAEFDKLFSNESK